MKITFLFFLFPLILFSQVKSNGDIWAAKEYSKEISLFNSKKFLFRDVLGISENILEFEVIPLAAASSGELTTLLYKCDSNKKEGLILGFYGNYWNEAGVLYQGYAYKNLNKDKATEFLDLIYSSIEKHAKFLKESNDFNNIVFKYDDMDILINTTFDGYNIRIFWNDFDATWEKTAFIRSKKRFEKIIKK
jgi:hypothetical protein